MRDPGLGNHWYGSTVCFKTRPGSCTLHGTQGLHLDQRAWCYFFPLPKCTSKYVLLLSQERCANISDAGSSEETPGWLSDIFYSLSQGIHYWLLSEMGHWARRACKHSYSILFWRADITSRVCLQIKRSGILTEGPTVLHEHFCCVLTESDG